MHAAGNQAGKMRHVDHEPGANLVGDFAEPLEVDDARIGRTAGNDQFRLVLQGEAFNLIDSRSGGVSGSHLVGTGVEPLAGLVDRRAVGQVTTAGKVKAHDRCHPACSSAKNTA